ncbi:ATP-binding protein [Thermobifida alba]|uniref:ATP-binding protein n=1 Tax=Thermobifida alba TaxID=53522 RepID=A0ABY4KX06_THEAE|nr:ATP-binding protein [Thermobifida alba]UPT19965.1 ATP-binding protein [Thermobifida alba]
MTVAFTSFPGIPDSVAAARRFVAAAIRLCPQATAPDEVVDRAVLITSELATNALRHTHSGDPGETFTVRVRTDARSVQAEVHTRAPRRWNSLPHVVAPDVPFAAHGRGLYLVDQLATTWGPLAPHRHGVYFHLTWNDAPLGRLVG